MIQMLTLEDLKRLSCKDRNDLYLRAENIISLIDKNNLPRRGLKLDDPVYLEIQALVQSPEGREAAIEATKKGLPALCGVDVLLQAKLGYQYRKEDGGTQCAGDLVAKMTRQLGYKEAGPGDCPENCTAKTGEKWR